MSRALLSRSVVGRFALAVLLLLAVMSVPVATQVPGQNVNMISVDKYLQKQNEVEVAISSLNPCHIGGAANDYRTVNNVDLNDTGEIGDSWIGFYLSTDCGDTWLNYIMPDYGVYYTSAADPVLRAGPGGGFYLGHIQFNRGVNWGKVAIARYVDYNNVEGVPRPATPAEDQSDLSASPVGFVGFLDVAKGSAGQFLDKPSIAVAPGRGKACKVPGGTVPSTNVYMAWSEFLSNSVAGARSKVIFARSTDCAKSLDGPAVKLSEGYPLGQGTSIAVHPTDPNIIYVAWRQIAVDRYPNAIMIVKSVDGGKSFTKPRAVTGKSYRPFDQPTTSTTFRTTGYPSIVMDEDGRLYLAYADRIGFDTYAGFVPTDDPSNDTKIILQSSRVVVTSTRDGVGWEPAQQLDELGSASPRHQFMPAVAYAGGRLNFTWYDLEYDNSGLSTPYANEKDALPSKGGSGNRRTLDIRAAQADKGWPLFPNVYGVSELNDPKKKVSLYLAETGPDVTPPGEQRNFNPPNFKLYSGGRKPFMGDYIGTAGVQWIIDGAGQWVFNGANVDPSNSVLRTFQTAWTDNRDAFVGLAGIEGTENPDLTHIVPGSGGSCGLGSVDLAKANSRNANIYTSRITPGLYLSALGNSKPTDKIDRAFALNVENGTPTDMEVQLAITAPSGVVASFKQGAASPVLETVTIPKFSSTARTVYVGKTNSTQPYPRIIVRAQQVGGDDLKAAVVLNPAPNNPLLIQPSNTTVPIGGDTPKETHTPRVEAPRVEAQSSRNPRVEAPRVEANSAEAPRVEAPRVEAPRVEAPRVEAPRVEAPRVEASAYENAPFTEITYGMTNDGNTTSAVNLNVFPSVPTTGYAFQLIGWRASQKPGVDEDCALTYFDEPQVFLNQVLAVGDLGFGGLSDLPSIVVRPGETVRWTLRAYDVINDGTFQQFCTDPFTAPGVDDCNHKLTTEVTAQAANTDEGAPSSGTWPLVRSMFRIVAPTLPLRAATLGRPYSVTFALEGTPTTPVTWVASELPAGLSINPGTGEVSGTPLQTGTFTFAVEATDDSPSPDGPHTDTRTFTIEVVLVPGDMIVADADFGDPGRLLLIAPGGATAVFASLPAGVRPDDVARGPNGDYYVTDASSGTVLRVSPSGVVSTLFTLDTLTRAPFAIAVDPDGSLYIGDNETDTVYHYVSSGSSWSAVASLPLGGPSPLLLQALDLAVVGHGVVVVAYNQHGGTTAGTTSAIEVMSFNSTPSVSAILAPPYAGVSGVIPSEHLRPGRRLRRAVRCDRPGGGGQPAESRHNARPVSHFGQWLGF